MQTEEIFGYIDHTQLNPCASWEDIKLLCGEALKYGTASVCIPPSYIARVRAEYPSLNICTVIGFPLGYSTAAAKIFEATDAAACGADEVDMVINQGDVKNGDFDRITDEIRGVKNAVGDKILKVIVETCNLTDEEKAKVCKCVTDGGADYIKTSTGFGSAGAKIEDIHIFRENIGAGVKMKAAGGVKTKADLEMFIEAGCERIGTSSAVKILTSGGNGAGY